MAHVQVHLHVPFVGPRKEYKQHWHLPCTMHGLTAAQGSEHLDTRQSPSSFAHRDVLKQERIESHTILLSGINSLERKYSSITLRLRHLRKIYEEPRARAAVPDLVVDRLHTGACLTYYDQYRSVLHIYRAFCIRHSHRTDARSQMCSLTA